MTARTYDCRDIKESECLGIQQAANGNKTSAFKQLYLFDTDNKPEPQWTEVDTANIRVENQLDFGGPWLALQLIHQLKLDQWLEAALPSGREEIAGSKMILVLVICR